MENVDRKVHMVHTLDKECRESGRQGNDSAGHTFRTGVILLVLLGAAVFVAVLIVVATITALWNFVKAVWCYLSAVWLFLLGRGKDLWDKFLQWRKEVELERQKREKIKKEMMVKAEQEANDRMKTERA